MLKPKFGLLKILTSAFFSKKNQNVKNLFFVPISLNFSRVLEGETFPLELLGESKVKESLSRIVNAARFVTMNFGSIYVEVGKPINFKDYAQDIIQTEGLDPFSNENDEKLITSHLGYTLIYKLTQNVMIMPTAVWAAILLMHRKGITQEELINQVDFLLKEIRYKNAMMPATCNNAKVWVQKGTFHLNETVSKKKDVFEPRVTPNVDYKNILLLSYYRNTLIHLFIQEAFVSCSLFGFTAEQIYKIGVTREDLWDKVFFISNLMRNEFVFDSHFKNFESFNVFIETMIDKRSLIVLDNGSIVIGPEQENYINFLNSLIWPFIDSYWATFVFIYTLVPSKFVQESRAYINTQALAERLYADQVMNFYESWSQEIIKNALTIFQENDVITKKKLETTTDGVVDPFVLTLSDKYNDEQEMLSLLEDISFFRKPAPIEKFSLSKIKKELNEIPSEAKM